jgi:hypothetical protein
MSDPMDDYFADHREQWRRLINGALNKSFRQYKLGPRDEFEMPNLDPRIAKAAVFQRPNAQVNLSDPSTWDARTAILRVIADAAGKVVRARIAETMSPATSHELTPNRT